MLVALGLKRVYGVVEKYYGQGFGFSQTLGKEGGTNQSIIVMFFGKTPDGRVFSYNVT